MILRRLFFFIFISVLPYQINAQSLAAKVVPLGGNSWVKVPVKDAKEAVTEKGWMNWSHKEAVWSTFIRVSAPGEFVLRALLHVPSGTSTLKWTLNGISHKVTINDPFSDTAFIGSCKVTAPGYIKVEAQGISRSGNIFAEVSDLLIASSADDHPIFYSYVPDNEGNYFYWGRRGPSVHINYDMTGLKDDAEWFYSEITVPKGNDVAGSYFMANGFAEGYFGMQVNSDTERRVLFSVWSPFNTDDPKSIPEDKKILLLGKGENVHTGEFGNEGSGGQSYLRYNWKAEDTCRFLLHGVPVANDHTQYTAYFFDKDKRKWLLIASFSRPSTHTYLKRLHSFLENFEPETGSITRKAFYHDQWVCTKGGEWVPLTTMTFTGDATANKGYRLDYAGGAENGCFFLQNCGFFNDPVKLKTVFTVPAPRQVPSVDLHSLH